MKPVRRGSYFGDDPSGWGQRIALAFSKGIEDADRDPEVQKIAGRTAEQLRAWTTQSHMRELAQRAIRTGTRPSVLLGVTDRQVAAIIDEACAIQVVLDRRPSQ